MPNDLVLGVWVMVIIVQVLGKYMFFGYLDPGINFLYMSYGLNSLSGVT